MNVQTQQIGLLITGAITIVAMIMNYEQIALVAIGIIGGFLSQKNLSEKQSEIIEQTLFEDGGNG